MNPKNFNPPESEASIEKRLHRALKLRDWYVKKTHGNYFQEGFPDTFACHQSYGYRWIETKRPKGFAFTDAQLREFPKFAAKKIGIWILTDDTDYEINKLFRPANWIFYLNVMKIISRARGSERIITEQEKRLSSSGPERDIQEIVKFELAKNDWEVKETYGNIFQSGLPDLYAMHRDYGARWIEIKNPKGYTFTPAQVTTFPMFDAHGVGVWILDAPNQLDRLFQPHNWRSYLK